MRQRQYWCNLSWENVELQGWSCWGSTSRDLRGRWVILEYTAKQKCESGRNWNQWMEWVQGNLGRSRGSSPWCPGWGGGTWGWAGVEVAEGSVPSGCVATWLPSLAHGYTQASWCHTPWWSATVKGTSVAGWDGRVSYWMSLAIALVGCPVSSIQKHYDWENSPMICLYNIIVLCLISFLTLISFRILLTLFMKFPYYLQIFFQFALCRA